MSTASLLTKWKAISDCPDCTDEPAPGHRVLDPVPGDRGGNLSPIGAIGLEGIRTGLSVPGAIDGETRLFFIEALLVPTLKRGDMVVMDNNSIHKLD